MNQASRRLLQSCPLLQGISHQLLVPSPSADTPHDLASFVWSPGEHFMTNPRPRERKHSANVRRHLAAIE